MTLLLASLLHPRSSIKRMLEVQDIARELGWEPWGQYGIIVDHVGYYVDCDWRADRPSIEAATTELEIAGLRLNEFQLHPFDVWEEVYRRRKEGGYYDDQDVHA